MTYLTLFLYFIYLIDLLFNSRNEVADYYSLHQNGVGAQSSACRAALSLFQYLAEFSNRPQDLAVRIEAY